ncbi:MAG: prephenate dehydrogenase [Anaerolineales bacterium]
MWLKDCHVHIVGLGLMGASLALALRGKVARRSGSDIDTAVVHEAIADGTIDASGEREQADIVVLAAPADANLRLLAELALKPGALVIDLGGSKTAICNLMDTLPEHITAVGGHPMCGIAENGYQNAFATLYAGARFILCATVRTTDTARGLAEQLVAACGAMPLWMDRARHDQTAGAISHLPHLVSFALMRLAMGLSEQNGDVFEMAAGGFDGATRLARTNEAMISGMFLTNEAQLRALVDDLRRHLDDLTALLDDPPALRAELERIVAARRAYTEQYGERMIT